MFDYLSSSAYFTHSIRDVVQKFIQQANKHHPNNQIYGWNIMWRCDFLRHHHIQRPKIQQRDALQTNGDIPTHVLRVFTRSYTFREQGKKASSKAKLQDSFEQTLQTKHLKKTLPHLRNTFNMERGYPQNFINNTLSELWNFKKGQQPFSNETKQRNESYQNTTHQFQISKKS